MSSLSCILSFTTKHVIPTEHPLYCKASFWEAERESHCGSGGGGVGCSCCWTDPDIIHQVKVCWMWERTLPFNPKAPSLFHSLLCEPWKWCMGLTSRQSEGPLRQALPSPAHSTYLGSSTEILRRTQTSCWTAQSTDHTALVSVVSLSQISWTR